MRCPLNERVVLLSIAFAIALVAAFIVMIKFLVRNKDSSRLIAKVFLAACIAVIILGTIGIRSYDSAGNSNLIPFKTIFVMLKKPVQIIKEQGLESLLVALKWIGYKSWESVIINFLMFVPLGYLIPLSFHRVNRWWMIVLLGFGFSLSIETMQILFHRGWFDVDDILLNSLGALGGYFVYKRIICD